MESETAYAVDRELIAADLDRIASALSPQIVSQLAQIVDQLAETVLTIDLPLGPRWTRALIAKAIRDRASRQLPASVAPQLSDALRRTLQLSDADLAMLCEVVAGQLGAWVGMGEPLPDSAFLAAFDPVTRLGAAGG